MILYFAKYDVSFSVLHFLNVENQFKLSDTIA